MLLSQRGIAPWNRRFSLPFSSAARQLNHRKQRVEVAAEAVARWLPECTLAAEEEGFSFSKASSLTLADRVNVIERIFIEKGSEDYFGEPVSHLEHALQCATLAKAAGHDEDVVVAALLHDIGHMCAPEGALRMDTDGGPDVGIMHHEELAADFLSVLGFSEKITKLVESHVPAKRYLVTQDQEYYDGLADDSRRSLMFQGGVMSEQEVDEFNSDSKLRDLMLEFRTFDEQAKVQHAHTPPLKFFMPMVERHLKSNCHR